VAAESPLADDVVALGEVKVPEVLWGEGGHRFGSIGGEREPHVGMETFF
jgi:hypothetical protein